MDKLNFIFTRTGFKVDDTNELKDDKWYQAFRKSKHNALYELGFQSELKNLSPSAFYLYQVSQKFFQLLSENQYIEELRENTKVSLDDETIEYLLSIVPYALGSELIDKTWIKNIFTKLNSIFVKEIHDCKDSVQMYLQQKSQDLSIAERIYFHLVENEEEKETPFAFLVTYATKDEEGRMVHMPLKHALVEYEGKQDKLLSLLSCLNKVAEKNKLIAQFMDSGELFHPIRLTSKEAYELLLDVPNIEKVGIKCRVPNWWKKKYSSVCMNVTIGQSKPSMFGMDSIVSMQPSIIVNGHALTKSEIQKLLKMEEGLAWLKGQWVEVNHHKLQ